MRDYSVKKKQLSECVKMVKVDDMDKEKDIIAERLIRELTTFLTQLKRKAKIFFRNEDKTGNRYTHA